mgnify:CR=1 FL=1
MEECQNILEIRNLKKSYMINKENSLQVLKGLNISIGSGEMVALMGASGCGKTTLINLICGIDKADSGSIMIDHEEITKIRRSKMAVFRRNNIGLIFQDFNLLDNFSLKDNIFLPLVLSGVDYKEMEKRIRPIAQKLGITELLEKYPYEVSGGQKQRAAVARALITNPELVLADEPTGALDSRATDGLLKLFSQINAEGQTVVMVTHSTKAASHANRILFIKDGEVFHQIYRGNATNEQLYVKISDALTVLTTGGEEHE